MIPRTGDPLSIPCGDGVAVIARATRIRAYTSFDQRVIAQVEFVFPRPSDVTERVTHVVSHVGIPLVDLTFSAKRQTWDVSPRFAKWCRWTTRMTT